MRKRSCVLLTAVCAAVLLILALAADREPSFSPDTVVMGQSLSSSSPPGPITDRETVERLWSLYQSFEWEGEQKTMNRENAWSISITFFNSESGEEARLVLFRGGLCWLEDDYETNRVLKNGDAIYQEFLDTYKLSYDKVCFNNRWYDRSALCKETLDWLDWYNGLTRGEQLSLSYIPGDLLEAAGITGAEASEIPAPAA